MILGSIKFKTRAREGGASVFTSSFLPFVFESAAASFGSEGMAEGGCGGNSAMPDRKILFSLGEKEVRRAQNEKSKEYFSVVVRAERATAGLASLVGILLKECSNFVQKTPPSFTFSEIERGCLGASRLGMVFFRNFPSIFEIARQRAVGNAEVRRAKLWSRLAGQTNLFSFAFSERLSVFFFDCPKTNFKTIWTT